GCTAPVTPCTVLVAAPAMSAAPLVIPIAPPSVMSLPTPIHRRDGEFESDALAAALAAPEAADDAADDASPAPEEIPAAIEDIAPVPTALEAESIDGAAEFNAPIVDATDSFACVGIACTGAIACAAPCPNAEALCVVASRDWFIAPRFDVVLFALCPTWEIDCDNAEFWDLDCCWVEFWLVCAVD